jgi:hypothetical protein
VSDPKRPSDIYRRRHKIGDVYGWARGHGPHRWRLALHWTQDHVRRLRGRLTRHPLPHDTREELQRQKERWESAQKVFAKKLAAARERHRQHGDDPKFETYMLNGHPGNVVAAVKQEIARAVVLRNAYVTATTDGTHATTSLHYPANNPDPATRAKNLGRAADHGGPTEAWEGHFNDELKRGASNYVELFGPPTPYVKNGALIKGTSPDTPNHCHCAPALRG